MSYIFLEAVLDHFTMTCFHLTLIAYILVYAALLCCCLFLFVFKFTYGAVFLFPNKFKAS